MTAPDLATELRGIRALVLDVDDTIVDTRGAMLEAGATAMAAVWPDHGPDHSAMAERYYTDPARWFPRYASGEVEFAAMRAGRLLEVAEAFALTLPTGGREVFEAAYAPAFRAAQRLFPDVEGLLDVADDLELPIVLLTNSSAEVTTVKLEALAIGHRFGGVVTTDTIGVGKPDPRTYLEACRLAGCRPGETLCVGDNVEWDVLGARAAGLRAVWLSRESAQSAAMPASAVRRSERTRGSSEAAASIGSTDSLESAERRLDPPTIGSLAELASALRTLGEGDLGARPPMGSISSRFTS